MDKEHICDENCDHEVSHDCDEECSHTKGGFLDAILAKGISRKLLVFMIATGLLMWSSLDPETWAMIATMYIGGQSAIDVAKVWKGLE